MAVIELFQVFFFSLIIIVELYYKNTFFLFGPMNPMQD